MIEKRTGWWINSSNLDHDSQNDPGDNHQHESQAAAHGALFSIPPSQHQPPFTAAVSLTLEM
jgi:hypothetical protein